MNCMIAPAAGLFVLAAVGKEAARTVGSHPARKLSYIKRKRLGNMPEVIDVPVSNRDCALGRTPWAGQTETLAGRSAASCLTGRLIGIWLFARSRSESSYSPNPPENSNCGTLAMRSPRKVLKLSLWARHFFNHFNMLPRA